MNLRGGGDVRQIQVQILVLTLRSYVAMGELVTSLRLWILVCRAGQTTLTGGQHFAQWLVGSTCSRGLWGP